MENVYKALQSLPKQYSITNGQSNIKIVYGNKYESPDLNTKLYDIEQCLINNNIKYERKNVKFFSYYPSFLIHIDEQNVGIITFEFGVFI